MNQGGIILVILAVVFAAIAIPSPLSDRAISVMGSALTILALGITLLSFNPDNLKKKTK